MAEMRAILQQHGKRVAGRVPLGYGADSYSKQLHVDEHQAVVVRDFFALASTAAWPSDLATLTNLGGWKDQKGASGQWTARRILKLIRNSVYVGKFRDGGSTPARQAHDRIESQDGTLSCIPNRLKRILIAVSVGRNSISLQRFRHSAIILGPSVWCGKDRSLGKQIGLFRNSSLSRRRCSSSCCAWLSCWASRFD